MKSHLLFLVVAVAFFIFGIWFQRVIGIGPLFKRIGVSYFSHLQTIDLSQLRIIQSRGIPEQSIVFTGDSLIAQQQWHELFPDLKIVNRGISGATINDLTTAFDYSPSKAVFCLIGTNDIGNGVSSSDFSKRYERLLATIGKDIKFHAISIPAFKNYNGRAVDPERIRESNATIKKLALIHGYKFINIYTESLIASEYFFSEDGLHLSPTGYQKFHDLLLPYLNKFK